MYFIYSLSRKNLVNSILKDSISCGINCNCVYEQGYGGTSNMSGQFQSVQAHITSKYS